MKHRKTTDRMKASMGAIFLLFSFWCNLLYAQNRPAFSGAPFIRNYPPDEYQAHNQNWGIIQDQRGVMYFGNSHGLLEYDGVSWRLIPIIKTRVVRSLAKSADGRIFAGGYGEIGYFAPDSARQLQFVSLLPQLEERYRNFTDVWGTRSTPEGIYFITANYIFRWNGQNMQVWTTSTSFYFNFLLNNQLYVHQSGSGLMHMVGDSLQLSPLGKKFKSELTTVILPFPGQNSKSILIGTRSEGLFLYDGASVTPFPTEADELLRSAQISCGIRLSNGHYAFGTMQRGIVILDEKGKLRQHLHKANGLQDDAILSLYEDRQKALWAGMQIGIARIETGSPLHYFGEREGIRGSIWEMVRHSGRLYFASIMGLFYLDETDDVFKKVAGVSTQCWGLLPYETSMLVASTDGVFEVRNGQTRRLSDETTFSLHRSLQNPRRVFAGLRKGVTSFYDEGGQWRNEGRLEGLDQEIRHFYETPDGKLWFIDYFNDLVRADFSKGYTRKPAMTRYGVKDGLPPPDRIIPFSTDRGLRFATLQGILAFEESSQHFYRDSTLVTGLSNPAIPLFSAARDPSGNLWLLGDAGVPSGVAWRQKQGEYSWDEGPFLRIAELPLFSIYPDPLYQQVVWIGSTDRVVRYDGAVSPNQTGDFSTLIRQVIANGDSLLYGGTGESSLLKLAYAYNSLRFRYATPSFDDESKNEYQYFLEGYDKDWSHWSPETYKDYTSLPPGKYRFMVRARNIYGQMGTTAVYELQVLPPFYRTWWAYLLYALLVAGAVFKLWQLMLQRIQRKQLQEMKQLEFNKLKELDELKSRFFANITHEFRTPLTLLIGPAENALNRLADMRTDELRGTLLTVQNNGYRLLNLVNQLLDLSRLEAGKVQLAHANGNLVAFLRYQIEACHSYAETRGIRMHFESNVPELPMAFDPEKIQTIVVNLLSNALKFTPQGGRIALKMIADHPQLTEFSKIVIRISDTGSGIPAEDLDRIFDRFYQVDNSTTRPGEGTGIGLALVQELVRLMQGTVSVESTVGAGTVFQVMLPYTAPLATSKDLAALPADRKIPPVALTTVVSDARQDTGGFSSTRNGRSSSLPHLLIIEDNPDVVAYLKTCLEGLYQLEVAYNGRIGIEKALNSIPDLIISDVMMPEKDGYEVCNTLKNDERTSHIPIILLTAKADSASRIEGLRRGADAYLPKPFDLKELLVRLEMLVERQKQMAAYFSKKTGTKPEIAPPEEKENYDIEDAFIGKVRQIIEENVADEDFALPQLCVALNMSRSQLLRKMKALADISPSDFIRAHRLQKARLLLESTSLTVSEVAWQVGYKDVSHFSKSFQGMFGVSPSEIMR